MGSIFWYIGWIFCTILFGKKGIVVDAHMEVCVHILRPLLIFIHHHMSILFCDRQHQIVYQDTVWSMVAKLFVQNYMSSLSPKCDHYLQNNLQLLLSQD